MKIDAVEQRTREPRLVLFCAARGPAAGRFCEMPATARVHRRDQLEPRGVGDVPLGAGDAHSTGLQWLAKRLERRTIELGQLVEKQDALVGEPDFSRTGARSAADEGRQRGRVVRIAKRPLAGQLAAAQPAGDRLDHAELERLAWLERR